MAYPRFYADGIDLKKIDVLQNERGWHYVNRKGLVGVLLKFFNTYWKSHPEWFIKVGSHTGFKYSFKEKLDFRLNAGAVITSNVDWVVTQATNYGGSYCTLESGARLFGKWGPKRYAVRPMHIMGFKKVGTVIKAGSPLCKVATQAHLKKYGHGEILPHLDIAGKNFGIEGRFMRKWILG